VKQYTQSQDGHAYWVPSYGDSVLDDIDTQINHVFENFQIPAYVIMSRGTYASFCTVMSRKNKQHFIQHYDTYTSEKLGCTLDVVQYHESCSWHLCVVPKPSNLNNGCFIRSPDYIDYCGAEKNHKQQMRDYENEQADKILLGDKDDK